MSVVIVPTNSDDNLILPLRGREGGGGQGGRGREGVAAQDIVLPGGSWSHKPHPCSLRQNILYQALLGLNTSLVPRHYIRGEGGEGGLGTRLGKH